MSIAIKEVVELYDFSIRVFKDIKNIVLRKKNEKFKIYGRMFNTIQYIHYDYTKMILDLHGGLIKKDDLRALKGAKSRFLQARLKLAPTRSVHKSEAKQYLESSTDLVEARYLFSVFLFLYYHDSANENIQNMTALDLNLYLALIDDRGGDGSLDSSSSSLWSQIQDDDDRESIIKKALSMKDCLDRRYSMVSTCYHDLESHWRYGSPAIKGGVDSLLGCIGVSEKKVIREEYLSLGQEDRDDGSALTGQF